MEPLETTLEETAGQTVAEATHTETPTVDDAAQTVDEETTAAESATTAPNSPEEADATPVEDVASESTEAIPNDAIPTESDATPMTVATTEQPEANTDRSCPWTGYDLQTLLFVVVFIVVAVIVVRLLTKNRSGKTNGKKSGGTGGNSDVVEIYAGNLSYDMTDPQLRREFERFGVVKSARVITHRTNGKSKGYGFVEMPHRKEAQIAIKALDTAEVMGRRLRVNEARVNTRPPEK